MADKWFLPRAGTPGSLRTRVGWRGRGTASSIYSIVYLEFLAEEGNTQYLPGETLRANVADA